MAKIKDEEKKNKSVVFPAIKAGLDTLGNAAMAPVAVLPDIGSNIMNAANAGVRAANTGLGYVTGKQYPESALPASNYPTTYTKDTLANAEASGRRFLELTGAIDAPGSITQPAPPKGTAVAGQITPPDPAVPIKPLYTDEGSPDYYKEPTQDQVATAPTLPGTAIISRGKFGEPLLTNQPGAVPVSPGVQPITPLSKLTPAGTMTLPSPPSRDALGNVLPALPGDVTLRRNEGDYNPYTGQRTSLRSMEGTATLPGGQVIQGSLDPETQGLVDARNAERQKQLEEFNNKYGLNLKYREFQASLPKIAAETGALQAQARKYDAEAQNMPFKAKTDEGQTLHDMIIQNNKAITTPDISLSLEENQARADLLESKNAKLWELLKKHEGRGATETEKKATGAKPTREAFIAKAKQSNPGYSDAEIAAEYDKRYGVK